MIWASAHREHGRKRQCSGSASKGQPLPILPRGWFLFRSHFGWGCRRSARPVHCMVVPVVARPPMPDFHSSSLSRPERWRFCFRGSVTRWPSALSLPLPSPATRQSHSMFQLPGLELFSSLLAERPCNPPVIPKATTAVTQTQTLTVQVTQSFYRIAFISRSGFFRVLESSERWHFH